MAKRKRSRPNLPQETLARARAELYGEEEAAKIAEKEAEEAAARPAPKPKTRKTYKGGVVTEREVLPAATSVEELRDEYVYVLADLRSMGILAGVLFVGLVVVSLILV